jgi:hypothetical protein
MEQMESLRRETVVLEILLDREPPGLRLVDSVCVPSDAKCLRDDDLDPRLSEHYQWSAGAVFYRAKDGRLFADVALTADDDEER